MRKSRFVIDDKYKKVGQYERLPFSGSMDELYRIMKNQDWWLWVGILAALAVAVGLGVVGIALGSRALNRMNDGFVTPMLETPMLNVTTKANVTDLTAGDMYVTLMNVVTSIVETLTATTATITTLTSTTLSSTTGTINSLSSSEGVITSLETTMHTQVPKVYTVSGTLDAAYNVHHLNGASALAMTLPADLTPLLNKKIKICSLSSFEDTVELLGGSNTFDADGYWQALRFEAKSPCCIEFEVESASQVTVLSRACTLYCANNDFYHCVDPDRPEETNAFHGWWRLAVKSGERYPYFEIDATTNPMTWKRYYGTVGRPRDATHYDSFSSAGGPRISALYQLFSANTLTESPRTDLDSSYDYGGDAFTLQPDKSTLFQYVSYTDYQSETDTAFSVYKKVDQDQVPLLTPYSTGMRENHVPPDDPVERLRELVELVMYNHNSQIGSFLNDEGFIGAQAAEGLMDAIIKDGVSYTSDIHKVWITQNLQDGLTRIRTTEWHHVAPVGTVTISGCTGSWAPFNGEHFVSPAGTTWNDLPNALYEDYTPGDPDASTLHFDVLLFFNSSDLPADGNGVGTATGPCQVTASYGPVNSGSDYKTMIGAYAHWSQEAFRVLSHHGWGHVQDPASTIPTGDLGTAKTRVSFDDVIADYAANTVLSEPTWSRSRGSVSEMYTGGARKAALIKIFFASLGFQTLDNRMTVGSIDINNRFDVRLDRDIFDVNSLYYYDIAENNYLTDVAVPYYYCSGNTKVDPYNLFGAFIYGSTSGGCDTFKAIMIPRNSVPSDPNQHLFYRSAPRNSGSPSGTDYATYKASNPLLWDIFTSMTFVGKVNTAYTGAEHICYIRFQDSAQIDSFQFVRVENFAPVGTEGGPRDQREAYASVFSDIMKYMLNDLNCTHVIQDIRNSNGGIGQSARSFREFFGTEDQRVHYNNLYPLTDNGDGAPIDVYTMNAESDIIAVADSANFVYPSVSAANYPGSVLTGGEVVILTDSRSFSGGDLHPSYYLGSAFDKDLGGGTHAQIIGDIDGRLQGCNSGNWYTARSLDSARVRISSGFAFSLTDVVVENTCLNLRADNSSMSNRIPAMAPDCAPSLTGLSGGCPLPNDEETIVFPDLGFVTNTRPRLTGDVRPQTPTPANRDEWRDAWLEQAIEAILVAKKKRKRNVESKISRPPAKRATKKRLTAREIYKRDISCPEGVILSNPADMPMTTIIQYDDTPTMSGSIHRENQQAIAQAVSMIRHELENGGLCVDQAGHLKATPSCENLPFLNSTFVATSVLAQVQQ